MNTSKIVTRDGRLSLEPMPYKVKYFTAKGIIKEISEGCRSFRLSTLPGDVDGVNVVKKGSVLNVEVSHNDAIMLKYWFRIGDKVSLKLLYKIYYRGDEQISKVYYINIYEIIEQTPPEIVQGVLF